MKPSDFAVYQTLLKEKSGLVLGEDKSYLLESRLTPVAKENGFESLEAMTASLGSLPNPAIVTAIVEAMTTNETSFFRDTRPFDVFKEAVLGYMKDARATKKLRIWCAAASSGQEPYTLAIVLKELAAEYPGWSFEIHATDISNDILDQARQGMYTQFEVQRGMPVMLLMKYFTQIEGDKWQLNDEIRNMVKYDYFNLLEPMARLGVFDVIFCRNVLIYFDEPTKGDVLERMLKQMAPDGFLFLGGAETVLGITDVFKPVPNQRGLYAATHGPHFQETGTQAIA